MQNFIVARTDNIDIHPRIGQLIRKGGIRGHLVISVFGTEPLQPFDRPGNRFESFFNELQLFYL